MPDVISDQDWLNAREYLETMEIKYREPADGESVSHVFYSGWIGALKALYDGGDRSPELFEMIISVE